MSKPCTNDECNVHSFWRSKNCPDCGFEYGWEDKLTKEQIVWIAVSKLKDGGAEAEEVEALCDLWALTRVTPKVDFEAWLAIAATMHFRYEIDNPSLRHAMQKFSMEGQL